jgi:hypothetical protein
MPCFFSPDYSIIRMRKVTLIFDEGIAEASPLSWCQNHDAPAVLGVSLYGVRSPWPESILQSLVKALNGTDITITTKNLSYFS